MNAIQQKAIRKAEEIRHSFNLRPFQPINVVDLCVEMGLIVKFIDINMEGMYVRSGNSSSILISNLRPLPRRFFTCAHELGHHVFDHASRIDSISEKASVGDTYDSDEFLVDNFAGALLMPIGGLQGEFNRRGLTPSIASSVQFYTIASSFGVGYQTLIRHCKANGLIDEPKSRDLLKSNPAKILSDIAGIPIDTSHFKIVDYYSRQTLVDLEVSNYLFLPKGFVVEGNLIQQYQIAGDNIIYIAIKPGVIRAFDPATNQSFFVRVQNKGYIGLAEYRHLENQID